MIATIGIVKGTAWKMVYAQDDPVLKDGFYYKNAGDPPAYVSADKKPMQDIHFHITMCLVARIPLDHDPADFIIELNYWFEPGTEAEIIDTEMIGYEVIT
jgi:hypothetical protein